MNDETYYGWCCTDCIMLIANGETPPEMNEDETAAWLENIVNRTRGYHVAPGGKHDDDCPRRLPNAQWRDDVDCACETKEFSWSACDHCGSGLGGSRHAFAMWAV